MHCPQKISARHRSPVGAGLPAKAVCQSLNIQLSHRYRRQASSHTSHALPTKNQRPAQIPCGSGLAREGGVSVTEYSTEPPLSQASQLPHWSCIAHKISAWHRSPVGAGLPAKAVCQSLNIQLSHRYRRQASSHRFWGGGWRSSFDAVVEGVAHCRYGNSLAIDDSRLVAKSIGRRQ